MAWTTPRTWTDGELVTAAIMNPHVRDNFLSMGPHLIARKTSDQAVTSSTVLVDCTTLTMPVAANEVWQFWFNVLYSAGTTGDFKMGFTFPASGRIDATWVFASTAGAFSFNIQSGTTTPSTPLTFNGNGTSDRQYMQIPGIFTNSTNAGSLQLQFAQSTSDGTATTVHANSTVWAVKLA